MVGEVVGPVVGLPVGLRLVGLAVGDTVGSVVIVDERFFLIVDEETNVSNVEERFIWNVMSTAFVWFVDDVVTNDMSTCTRSLR